MKCPFFLDLGSIRSADVPNFSPSLFFFYYFALMEQNTIENDNIHTCMSGTAMAKFEGTARAHGNQHWAAFWELLAKLRSAHCPCVSFFTGQFAHSLASHACEQERQKMRYVPLLHLPQQHRAIGFQVKFSVC